MDAPSGKLGTQTRPPVAPLADWGVLTGVGLIPALPRHLLHPATAPMAIVVHWSPSHHRRDLSAPTRIYSAPFRVRPVGARLTVSSHLKRMYPFGNSVSQGIERTVVEAAQGRALRNDLP